METRSENVEYGFIGPTIAVSLLKCEKERFFCKMCRSSLWSLMARVAWWQNRWLCLCFCFHLCLCLYFCLQLCLFLCFCLHLCLQLFFCWCKCAKVPGWLGGQVGGWAAPSWCQLWMPHRPDSWNRLSGSPSPLAVPPWVTSHYRQHRLWPRHHHRRRRHLHCNHNRHRRPHNRIMYKIILPKQCEVGVGDVCFFLTMRCFNDAMFPNLNYAMFWTMFFNF